MAVFATKIWARKAGLVPPVGKDWEIQFRILTTGKMPTDTAALKTTELWMMIAKDIFWVDIQHGGKRDSISMWNRGEPHRHDDELKLPTPKLDKIDRWIAAAEKRFGKSFRRDKVWVKSNIKGGRDAVVAWIANGYRFG